MANFVDFVSDASKDNDMAKEFMDQLSKASPEDLSKWLKEKGYDVSAEDSKKLIENKDSIATVGDTGVRTY